MKYSVFLTESASCDIVEIWKFIALNDSIIAAGKIRRGLEKTVRNLEVLPERGHVCPELERIGVFDYREVHFKTFRLIYFIKEENIFVVGIFDGRRELQEILIQRSLRIK